MTQVMAFPKELERHFFHDADKDFLLIWTICMIISLIFTGYMSTLPPKEMSDADIIRYQQIIYRAKPAVKSVTKRVEKTQDIGKTEPVEPERPAPGEKPKTEVGKQAARQEARAERQDRQEARLQRAQAVARKVAILGTPTAIGGRRTVGDASEAAKTLKLSSGGVKGSDLSKMVGIVDDAGTADKVKAIRGTGIISEDLADINIGDLIKDLKAMSASDLDKLLQEAPVRVNRPVVTASGGKGSGSAKRSPGTISEILQQKINQIKYCYLTFKRRDSSLKGRLVVEFTVEANGSVKRVRFRERDWSGNPLGADVERCIESIITSWQFETIDPSQGDAKFGATYIFEG
ncbi:MAG: AgmX/PglI C-terminal domain-containing protein [Calditrichota bacterium]